MKVMNSVALAVCVVMVSTSHAQGTRPVSLEDAVRSALRSNHEVEAARLEAERARARVSEAIGYALPRIDLTARYTRAIKKPIFFLPDFQDPGSGRVQPIEIGSNHAFDLTLTAEQTLFNFAVFIGVGTAQIYSQAAVDLYTSKQLEVATAARKAFYGVLVASEVAAMMQQHLANAEENLRNVIARTSQGLESEYDQLRAEVAVENLRPEVIKAENNHRLALNTLKTIMGLQYSEEIATVGELQPTPVDETLLNEAVEAVLAANPTLSAMRHQVDVNDAIVGVEVSEYLPRLSAFANYQRTAQKDRFTLSTRDLLASSTVGISLTLNIFNGLQTNARVAQAKLERRKSEHQVAGVEIQLQSTVEALILQIRRAQQRIEAQEKTVEQAERGYRIASSRFAAGLGIQVEVNDAQLALTQAKVNRIEAIHELLVASAELDRLLGRFPSYVHEGRENETNK